MNLLMKFFKKLWNLEENFLKNVKFIITLSRILSAGRFSNVFQTFRNLVEAPFAAIQFEARLFAGFVENFSAHRSASGVCNVVATAFAVFASFQTSVKFRFVARTTRASEIFLRACEGARRSTNRILSQVATSPAHPIFVLHRV